MKSARRVRATRTRPNQCPNCGYLCGAAAPLAGSADVPPEAGDFSLCLNCGQLLVFTAGMGLAFGDPAGLAAEQRQQVAAAQRWIKNRGPLPRMRNLKP